jgi:hypothetical protein
VEYWYLIVIADLAPLSILRLRSRTTQQPDYAPNEGLAAHRLSGGVAS